MAVLREIICTNVHCEMRQRKHEHTTGYSRRGRNVLLYWRRGVVVSGVRRMNEVNARRARLVPGWVTVNSALHPSGVAESSTSFGWGKGGNVTSAGWQVTLCDPMWHASFRSGVATLRTAIHLLLTYLLLRRVTDAWGCGVW